MSIERTANSRGRTFAGIVLASMFEGFIAWVFVAGMEKPALGFLCISVVVLAAVAWLVLPGGLLAKTEDGASRAHVFVAVAAVIGYIACTIYSVFAYGITITVPASICLAASVTLVLRPTLRRSATIAETVVAVLAFPVGVSFLLNGGAVLLEGQLPCALAFLFGGTGVVVAGITVLRWGSIRYWVALVAGGAGVLFTSVTLLFFGNAYAWMPEHLVMLCMGGLALLISGVSDRFWGSAEHKGRFVLGGVVILLTAAWFLRDVQDLIDGSTWHGVPLLLTVVGLPLSWAAVLLGGAAVLSMGVRPATLKSWVESAVSWAKAPLSQRSEAKSGRPVDSTTTLDPGSRTGEDGASRSV